MNIFIAGGGRVGSHLARLLSTEHQDVTVIERNADRLEQIDYALDVSTAPGDGTSVMLQQAIGVGTADLFVASMGDDACNLIAAATAKGLGAKQVVARVDNPMYIDANVLYETILGINYIMSPDALAALEIANFIEHPGIMAVQDFGRGLIQMRQIRCSRTPTVNGKALKDIIPPGSGVLLGLISRRGKTIIPHGDSIVEIGDLVTLVGHRDKLSGVQKLFHGDEQKPRRVVIMGGGTTGMRLAQAVEGRVKSVKIIERHPERSRELAEQLPRVKVVCRDGTSRASLEQEHLDKIDVFVAATGDDERNIMAGVLAREVGARMSVAIVHQPDFAPLVERLGIDLAVTPRACIANSILKLVHLGQVTSLAVLGEGQVEVMEMPVGDGSPMLGRQLKDLSAKIPRDALIATILRGDKVIVPSGNDEIHAGDSLVMIVAAEALEQVRKLLQKRS